MKRLDDIRGVSQAVKPRLRKLGKSQKKSKRSVIRRPVRIRRVFRPLNIFKLPVRFIWRYKLQILILIVLVCIVGGGVFLLAGRIVEKNADSEQGYSRKRDLEGVVIREDMKLLVDLTFNLKMSINGQPQAIPADYGKAEDEKAIFSTDTGSGDIQVQSPNKEAYTVSDFFVLWGSQFNSTCLLNHCLGGVGSLSMTVNGKINPKLNNYVIKEGDQIVITYNDLP